MQGITKFDAYKLCQKVRRNCKYKKMFLPWSSTFNIAYSSRCSHAVSNACLQKLWKHIYNINIASFSLTTCSFAHFLITGAMKGYKEEREWEEHDHNTFVSHKVAPASKLLLTSYNLTHYNICICLQNNTVENRKLDLSG